MGGQVQSQERRIAAFALPDNPVAAQISFALNTDCRRMRRTHPPVLPGLGASAPVGSGVGLERLAVETKRKND